MNQDPALEVDTASTLSGLKDSFRAQGPRPILGFWPAWLVSGIVLTYLAIQFLWLPPTPKVDYSGLIAETLICFIPLAGLFVVQSLRQNPGVYWPMLVGLSLLLLSHVTDALDEVRVQPVLVGILLEDGLAVLGYAFLVWGLVRWIGYNGQLLEALEGSSQRLMTVLNAMEATIYVADMDTHEILFLNQSARQIFGPVEGQLCYQVLQGLDAPCPFCTNDQLVNTDGSPAGVYAWEFQNHLNQRWYDLRDCAVRWTDGRLVRMEIATDITERKRNEVELHQAREAAEAANRALQSANDELQRLVTTDRLTGIWNRAHFDEVAAQETARAARYGEPLSLLLFDIDYFKAINDTHGHLIGDQVLIELTRRVGEHLRANDVLARWGGEEFVVMLPHCAAAEALRVAEKLRALVQAQPFARVGQVTASFGVADFRPADNLDTWLKRADDALYAAKAAGRNQVCLGASPPS